MEGLRFAIMSDGFASRRSHESYRGGRRNYVQNRESEQGQLPSAAADHQGFRGRGRGQQSGREVDCPPPGRGRGRGRGERRGGGGNGRGWRSRGRGRDNVPVELDRQDTPECEVCQQITYLTTKIVLKKYLDDLTTGKMKKKIGQFMEAVNGMLNDKGGGVIIHVKEPELLGQFDEKIDDRLMQLIPDDTLFHDNFERFFHDKNHVVFRVKPRSKDRPLSTLDFNSKVSSNKGQADPSQFQVRAVIRNAMQPPSQQRHRTNIQHSIAFTKDQQVMVRQSPFTEPFQESMSMQAKRVCLDNIRLSASGKLDAENLANYCWNDVRLPQYISAFAKIRNGGSIFLGVMEEDKPKLWIQVQSAEVDGLFTVHDSDFKVWKENEENEDSKMVYHVAREDAVPDKKTKPSGKFMCQGVCLTKDEQKRFCENIQKKIRTKMLWLGLSKPINPVTIQFHGVTNGHADMCVIEIQVDFFHGVAFHHNEGPVSYKCSGPTGQTEQIQLEAWVDMNGGTTKDKAKAGELYLDTQTPEFS